MAYPERLAMLMRENFRNHTIDVLNRGVGGQEATTELARFEPDVLAEEPALVIWQVGTNAVFRKERVRFRSGDRRHCDGAASVGGARRSMS